MPVVDSPTPAAGEGNRKTEAGFTSTAGIDSGFPYNHTTRNTETMSDPTKVEMNIEATDQLIQRAADVRDQSLRLVGKHVLLTLMWTVMGLYLVIAATASRSSVTLTLSVIALFCGGMHFAQYRDAVKTTRNMRRLITTVKTARGEQVDV
jgi:hypothetical protein